MLGFPIPPYMPCPDCGASVSADARDSHECDEQRRLDYELFQLRRLDRFESDLLGWLVTPAGQFAAFWAEYERDRRLGA